MLGGREENGCAKRASQAGIRIEPLRDDELMGDEGVFQPPGYIDMPSIHVTARSDELPSGRVIRRDEK